MTASAESSTISVADVQANVERVHARIRAAGGDPARLTLVAVTKAHEVGYVRSALGAGLHDVGENYAQELVDKAASLEASGDADRARFHFIGRLQRNKVRSLASLVHLWQTVDREELGREIAKRAPGAAVLVQVNATAEPQKGGCAIDEVPALVEGLRRHELDVRGLMAVGQAGDADVTARAFDAVADLATRLDLIERSMGMSADLELAVRAGATMVRIGRDLFGARPPADEGGGAAAPAEPERMRREQEERLE